MKKSFGNQVAAAEVGLAAVFGGTPPASAAIVTGSWDPAFAAGPLQNLGWLTTINFFVPTQCFAGAGGIKINLFGQSYFCNGLLPTPKITVLSAEVGLYSLSTNTIVDVLTFNPATLPLFLVNIDPNDTLNFFLATQPSSPAQGGVLSDPAFTSQLNQFNFRLRLAGSLPQLEYRSGNTGPYTIATSPTLNGQSIELDDTMAGAIINTTALRVGQQAIPIPEPTSVALVLLALAAGGVASRRRA